MDLGFVVGDGNYELVWPDQVLCAQWLDLPSYWITNVQAKGYGANPYALVVGGNQIEREFPVVPFNYGHFPYGFRVSGDR